MVLAPRVTARGAFLGYDMTSNTTGVACLFTITGLVLAQGGLLLVAGVGSEALVEQLRDDIDLLLILSGVITTALVTTIGILWRSLRASQNEFIKTLKKIKDN